MIPERLQILLRRQLVRHEAELDERLHAVGEQPVVNLIDVGKVVDRLPVLVLVVNSDVVEQNAVKADVLEIR